MLNITGILLKPYFQALLLNSARKCRSEFSVRKSQFDKYCASRDFVTFSQLFLLNSFIPGLSCSLFFNFSMASKYALVPTGGRTSLNISCRLLILLFTVLSFYNDA